MTDVERSRRPGRARSGARALLAVATATAALAWLSAAPAGASETTQTVTFTTAGESTYSIPAGAVSLAVTLIGAPGAKGFSGTPGQGAQVVATIPLPSGLPNGTTTLYVEVGSAGGTYGGGASQYGSAGGGEAAIETCSAVSSACTANFTASPASDPRLFVAGGGGGGGENSFATGTGGTGGNAGSGTATGPGSGGAGTDTGNGVQGADAGSASSGLQAPAGPGSSDCQIINGSAANGTLGSPGVGGAGTTTISDSSNGGGGGGGWVGGSGGGAGDCPLGNGGSGGGGGAGASFAETAATGVTMSTASSSATPEVQIVATIDYAPTITSGNATTFTAGASGTFTVTSNGSPTAALSETGTLPTGVTFTDNGNGTATLAGAAAAGTGGRYPITVNATNSLGSATPQSFTLTVDEAPTITSGSAATFVVGQSGTTFTVTTGGYPAPTVTDGQTELPSGLTLKDNGNGTATLSGTPAAGTAGVYNFYLFADNGIRPGASQPFTLTVDQAPSITSASSTTFSVGHAGTFTVTTTGYPSGPAIALSDGNVALPGGVTFHDNGNGTATIAGTPARGTGGLYSFNITATSSVSPPFVQAFSLAVQEAPTFSSPAATSLTVGSPANFAVTVTGYPIPEVLESGALPAGVTLTLNPANGSLKFTGTPAGGTGGVYPLSFTASNGISPDAAQSFTLTVRQAPAVTSRASATFTVGTKGTFLVTTTGFPVSQITESGALPKGVTLVDSHHGSATLSGTPASLTGGVYRFTVVASNGVSPTAQQAFTLTVLEPPIFTSAASARFPLGQPGSFTVKVASFPAGAAVHLGLSGKLPVGVTFHDNGNGTATIAGTAADTSTVAYPVTVTATNGVGSTSLQHLTIYVVSGPGYILLTANGGVLTYGGSHFVGSLPSRGIKINDMIGAAETLDARGYWLVDGVGGVFNFGDAKAFGLAGKPLNRPVVAVVPTPDDGGYWLIARDGGVFSYGDARYFGSLPAMGVHVTNVVGMVSTLDGRGYYVALSSGAVYAFGDAVPRGSVAHPGSAIVGIAFDRATGGYWLVSANGSVFGFNARYYGGTPSAGSIIGIATSSDAGGYLLLAKGGTVYAHGDAVSAGPLPPGTTNSPVVAISSP